MPLYIRDDAVDELAAKVQAELGARTKTEAVRTALEHELQRLHAGKSFEEKIAKALALADEIGPPNPEFNEKGFMDEMWGE
ncbi:MAG TPA: type II toxin-antitoxin system VapB family antitoxin [Methylocystis sp.]|nr:type II toxin-antitoxin system VapB family antitoxin [Methylocystis sp.]